MEKMKAQSAYIACCVWGGDMNELSPQKKKAILGIDKPVEPSMLRGFY